MGSSDILFTFLLTHFASSVTSTSIGDIKKFDISPRENIIHDKHMFYRGGNETIVERQDPVKWIFFEIINLVKDLGYDGFTLWRKIAGFDEWFMHFIDHVEAEEIANNNLDNNVDVHIWLEQGVEDVLSKMLRPHVDQLSEGSGDVSSYDDVRGIRFYDSEEERTCERNEEFVKVVLERPTHRNEVWLTRNPNNVGNQNIDYESEELESSDPDDSGNEKHLKYEKFRGDLLNKEF
ncbi:hypothetical protein KIW84_013200 [Lathyrus oleraceus]|uniref:Uncharacterized protein n=1 Tax=Pisum sativum TaxID=3888 RepID=A0A9D5GXN5_PEA|nr:hypothetical protein KIW84_013200 [Pisum sativum]